MGMINYLNNKRIALMDSLGNNIDNDNPLPQTSTNDFVRDSSLGLVTGWRNIFYSAENEAVGATIATIRFGGGRFPFPTVASKWDLVSDNANDVFGGTGAEVFALSGQDDDNVEQAEIISMNGLTKVATTLDFFRISGGQVVQSDTRDGNLGTISILNGTDNMGKVLPNDGSLRQLVFTVPKDKSWQATSFTVTAGKGDEISTFPRAWIAGAPITFSKTFYYQGGLQLVNTNPAPIPERTDFEVLAQRTGDAGTVRLSVTLEFIERDNSTL